MAINGFVFINICHYYPTNKVRIINCLDKKFNFFEKSVVNFMYLLNINVCLNLILLE